VTTTASPAVGPSAFYRDDEAVIQSHPLLPGATPPRFGGTDCWDLNGVVHKAPSHASAAIRVLFHDLTPAWNLMARELAMLWLNPRHPAILAAGVHLRADPLAVMTVTQRIGHLRPLAAFGAERGLPPDLRGWNPEDFKAYIAHRQTITEPGSVTNHVQLIKALHQFRAALTCGGLPHDPWPGISTNAVANQPIVPELRTPVIPPETWFPLIRNCWTYIDVFAPDILRAAAHWDELRSRPLTGPDAARRFDTWLADTANTIPTRRARPSETPGPKINISLLARIIGVRPDFFQNSTPHGRWRRKALERLVVNGRTHPGLLPDLAEVSRPDGSRGPWHDSLGPTELQVEQVMLRNACFVFTAALSMMRECELRTITKDALVEHYGSPAVKSTKQKLDPGLPIKHWWITPPVARAIELAGRLSQHDKLVFASVGDRWAGDSFASIAAIDDFINHINRWRHASGLEEIPDGKVTPHMFRRTMAMLTRDFPGSEIAVGMQLKHVTTRALANRVTGSYMDNDPSWARHLDTAIADRRFDRLTELFNADTAGQHIGYGPGADRIREAFAAVRDQAERLRATGQAQRGDIRVEHDLLRRTRISIRFGKLNHCTMNDNDPTGAKCIEDAISPDGHRGPLLDRCQPGRCPNSVVAPEHIPIWTAERSALGRILADGKIAANHRRRIESELQEVDRVLKRSNQ
jgi:integrase